VDLEARSIGGFRDVDARFLGAQRRRPVHVEGDSVGGHLDEGLRHRSQVEGAPIARVDAEVQRVIRRRIRHHPAKGVGRRIRDRDRRRRGVAQLDAELLRQLAGSLELLDDVAASDEFALDVELRDRGPGGVLLDPLAQVRIREHVEGLIRRQEAVEDPHDRRGESALGRLAIALHEEQHVVGLDQGRDLLAGCFVEAHCRGPPSGSGRGPPGPRERVGRGE